MRPIYYLYVAAFKGSGPVQFAVPDQGRPSSVHPQPRFIIRCVRLSFYPFDGWVPFVSSNTETGIVAGIDECRHGPDERTSAAQGQRADCSCEAAQMLQALYDEHFHLLVNNLRKLFGAGPPDPEDVVQQAFRKILERGDLSDIADLPRYLWGTARNLVIEAKRAEDVRTGRDFEIEHLFFSGAGVGSSPEIVLSSREQLRLINAALGKMPITRRRAFLLHRLDGLSLSETARRLGLSRNAVTKHVARAAKDIDLALADVSDEQDERKENDR